MTTNIKTLIDLIDSAKSLDDSEKQSILEISHAIKKDLTKLDFKYERMRMDKKIVEKAFYSTIQDLEKNRNHIEKINKRLSHQKETLKTQKKTIEEKTIVLEENLKKLELSYKEMEQFTYIASHDLKSPLRIISNFAQLLKRKNYDTLSDESKEYVDFIISGAKQMHEVICDSLEYSKIGKDEDSFQKTDLNTILESVKNNIKDEIEENNATIISAPLPRMQVNQPSMTQLFQHLISNAIKFRTAASPVIKISCQPEKRGYEFTIADNGIGIDEAFQDKVFMPFQRLNIQNNHGNGIGLAICKKVVKMHDGDITYNSKPGEGTTFTFRLHNKSNIGDDSPYPDKPLLASAF